MFIDPWLRNRPRAPEERNVLDDEYSDAWVPLLRSGRSLGELAFYKHFVPTGREPSTLAGSEFRVPSSEFRVPSFELDEEPCGCSVKA
jgi:hypothetical protein